MNKSYIRAYEEEYETGMDYLSWIRLGIYFFTWVGGLIANFLGIFKHLRNFYLRIV